MTGGNDRETQVLIRAEGSPVFVPHLRGSGGFNEEYSPVEGVVLRQRRVDDQVHRRGLPPGSIVAGASEIMEFLVSIKDPAAAVLFAIHLMKAASGRVRIWINDRRVDDQEEALAVLREAYGDEE